MLKRGMNDVTLGKSMEVAKDRNWKNTNFGGVRNLRYWRKKGLSKEEGGIIITEIENKHWMKVLD